MFVEFDVEFKFAKIQNSHFVCVWGGGGFVEFDVEFKFAKIQNSHFVCVCVGGFVEFDVEFKFAKIQNSHFCVCVWGGGGFLRNLMLSSNLPKSKIPILWGGGVGGTNFQLLMPSSNLLKKKKFFFVKKFLSFQTKSITVLFSTLSTKWLTYTKYRQTTISHDHYFSGSLTADHAIVQNSTDSVPNLTPVFVMF